MTQPDMQTYDTQRISDAATRAGLGRHVKTYGAQEWGLRIQEGVAIHQIPTALATLGAGQPVEFGSITLSAAGVTGYGTVVPWVDITDVDIAESRLRIKTAAKRPPITTPISSLTNLNLLYALIERGRGL
ncbi:DUF6585 family protein [Nocardia sp. NPDC059091]|uniref:DUF6585 family protein n=1 Tax=unclassified Nocardia TaxID=2637762 RepID=UPI0036800978